MIIRRVGLVRRILVASPEFLARSGPIDTLEQLSRVDVVTTPNMLAPDDILTLKRRAR